MQAHRIKTARPGFYHLVMRHKNIIFGILGWTMLISVESYSLDYGELQKLNVSCAQQEDSCQNKTFITPDTMSCECDPLCGRRGTCCIDSTFITPSQKPIETCQSVYDPFHKDVYMVSQCDPTWSGDPNTKSQCESPWNLMDPVQRVPVTVSAAQITYRNYFCAQCNNYRGPMVFWNFTAHVYFRPGEVGTIDRHRFFDNLEFGHYGWHYRFRNKDLGDRMVGMDFGYFPPDGVKDLLKECAFGIQSTCSDTWPDDQVRAKCGDYMALIYVNDKRGYQGRFRNVHCAICCNLTIEETSCGGLARLIRPDRPFKYEPGPEDFVISLSDGIEMGQAGCCQPGQIIDPFNGRNSRKGLDCARVKCRSISCGMPGYVVRNFTCVPTSSA